MKKQRTSRGFAMRRFTDRYGKECSLQKSSLAFENTIWLGIDQAQPVILNSEAQRLGLPSCGNTGWTEFYLPEGVHIASRMHLTRLQVLRLLPSLVMFVVTGRL